MKKVVITTFKLNEIVDEREEEGLTLEQYLEKIADNYIKEKQPNGTFKFFHGNEKENEQGVKEYWFFGEELEMTQEEIKAKQKIDTWNELFPNVNEAMACYFNEFVGTDEDSEVMDGIEIEIRAYAEIYAKKLLKELKEIFGYEIDNSLLPEHDI